MATRPDAWKRYSVLTMDGGGIRGYATLKILEALMAAIEREERDRPESHESSFWPLDYSTITIQNSQQSDANGNAENDPESSVQPTLTPTPAAINNSNSDILLIHPATDMTTPDIQRLSQKELEGFLPCHYFDLIAGTSTGGLNAIMLSRLRMSVKECLQEYPQLAKRTFGKKKQIGQRIVSGSKYDETPLIEEINRLVNQRTYHKPPRDKPPRGKYEYHMYPSPGDLCRTVVVSSFDDGAAPQSFLFRTYDNPTPQALNQGDAQNYPISVVARATSAADLKFDPVIIGERTFYDGGIGDNNPAPKILDEVLTTCGHDIPSILNMFVSIGTGEKPKTREKVKQNLPSAIRKRVGLIDAIANAVGKLKRHGTEVERHHQEMVRLLRYGHCQQISSNPERFEQYIRFPGGDIIGILKLDQWFTTKKRTLNNMTTQEFMDHHIQAYLSDKDVIDELNRCAKALVDQRRARITSNPDKWRRFAHATLQTCPLKKCPKQLHRTKAKVTQHIKQAHPSWTDQQQLIDSIFEYAPRLERGPF